MFLLSQVAVRDFRCTSLDASSQEAIKLQTSCQLGGWVLAVDSRLKMSLESLETTHPPPNSKKTTNRWKTTL